MDINAGGRRRSGATAGEREAPPQMQVVGFHVEGLSASPMTDSMLLSNSLTTGSPSPVIIPPSFQRHESGKERGPAEVEAAVQHSGSALGPASAPRTSGFYSAGPDSPQRLVVHERGTVSQPDSPHRATKHAQAPSLTTVVDELRTAVAGDMAGSSTGPIAIPTSRDGDAPSVSVSSAPTSTSSAATPVAVSTPSASNPSAVTPSAVASAAAGAPAGAPAAVVKGAAAALTAAGGGGNAPAEKLKTSKAERRELQERQRAEKAAAKGGAAGGTAASAAPAAKGKPPPDATEGARRGSSGGADKGAGGGAAAGGAGKTSGASQKGGGGGGASTASGHTFNRTSEGPSSSAGASSAAGAVPAAASLASPAAAGAATPVASSKRKDKAMSLNSTELFAHLQQYRQVTGAQLLHRDVSQVHPAIMQLGLRYANGTIKGANARCMAMLHALSQMIRDYSTPDGKSLSRDLTVLLNGAISFLVGCRPLSFSMGNAIKHLKLRISGIDPNVPEDEAKAFLIGEIAEFVNVRISGADKLLVTSACYKVETGDVVLTYAYSSIVAEVLCSAASQGRRFRVIVIDSRPELEGQQMLQRMLQVGIPCSYTHINGLSYIVQEATKVFLGAAAVLSNGVVVSRVGSAAVAMVANAHNRPVLICCESYKFHERVQLDSVTNNELGDPEALASVQGRPGPLAGWQDTPHLGLLNLKYDAMPAEYVTMIITEFGMIPPTSVPVILREYRQEL